LALKIAAARRSPLTPLEILRLIRDVSLANRDIIGGPSLDQLTGRLPEITTAAISRFSAIHERNALMGCCWRRSATPIRSCSWSRRASTAPSRAKWRTAPKRFPLDVALILREGRDVTLISWGAMVKETLTAADELAADDISAE
jgi:Transketolase, C-terminal domain